MQSRDRVAMDVGGTFLDIALTGEQAGESWIEGVPSFLINCRSSS